MNTEIVKDPSRCATNVVCSSCGELVAWVTDSMRREYPARARALLSAHHATKAECEMAKRVVLVCDLHGKITGPIINSRHEIRVCTNRHGAAGCQHPVHARPAMVGEGE